MIIEEIKEIKETDKDLRKFGITIGSVLVIVNILLMISGKHSIIYFVIAAILLFFAFVKPVILKPLNKVWMILGILMGWIMTRVILIFLFYFALTLISALSKIFKKDFLDQRLDKSRKSYWLKRETKSSGTTEYERQF